jgi:hypothetical protein
VADGGAVEAAIDQLLVELAVSGGQLDVVGDRTLADTIAAEDRA